MVAIVNREEATDIFHGVGQEILLNESDDFLKIKETLTRIGTVENEHTIIQACYILHKRGKYAILHEKELLSLDQGKVVAKENDIQQRKTVVRLLQQWKLLSLTTSTDTTVNMHGLKVVLFKDKDKWSFVSQYNIGRKNNADSSK